jgi:glycosyltransferase involved in cell wall biosynthesis
MNKPINFNSAKHLGSNPTEQVLSLTPQFKVRGRLMILITGLTFGGAETQAIRIAVELKERGWEVCVVSMIDPVAYVDKLREKGIHVYSLAMRRGTPDLRGLFRLKRLIDAFRPTIIHSHMFHANILGRFTRLFCKIPRLICTVHNLRETSEKGGATWHKELIYKITDHLAEKTTIICSAAFERYVKVRAVPESKLQMIPNGVDTRVFSTSPAEKEAARNALALQPGFVWLAVGRMVKQKNYASLFDAIEQLGTSEFTLLVVGGGPLESELRARREQSFLKDKIHFCGTHEDILKFYSAADGFVMSSEFEGLSAALLEAASMGLPAVVTDVGGNADVVIDGQTGYVVPPDNPAQLALAMRRLMDAPTETRNMFSELARRHAHDQFSFSVIVEKWLTLYGESPDEYHSRETGETSSNVDLVVVK